MNVPSALDQYIANQLPDDPSQITTTVVPAITSAPGFSALSITYQKVGKLYFNIRATSIAGGFNNMMIQDDANSVGEVISLIGISVNTKYSQASVYMAGGNCDVAKYNVGGGYWEQTNSGGAKDMLFSILAN